MGKEFRDSHVAHLERREIYLGNAAMHFGSESQNGGVEPQEKKST